MFWNRRRYLVACLAFLGFFTLNILRSNLSYALGPMRSPYNVTLDNGTVVEKQDFDWPEQEVSHIAHASFFGYVATQILGGWLGACLGGSRVFGVGVALTALFSLVTPFVANTGVVNLLIAIRVIEGLFEGVTYPSIIAVWSRWAPPQERARLVAIAFSGSYFSIVINSSVFHIIAKTLGWSYVFYITGIIGLIWFAVWWTVVTDKPEDDPHISTEELKFLKENIDCGPNDYIPKHIIYPWDKFVTSMPVWAIVVADTCMSWGSTLMALLPIFVRETYDYEVDETRFLSLLPHLVMAVLMPVAGTLADWLRNSEVLTTTQFADNIPIDCRTLISHCLSGNSLSAGKVITFLIWKSLRSLQALILQVVSVVLVYFAMALSERERITLLMMRGFGDRIRSCDEMGLQNPVGFLDISLVSQAKNNLTVALKGDLTSPPPTKHGTRSESTPSVDGSGRDEPTTPG
ncbi:hypothetical protein J6590_008630 [Homalodisca vitripennis]|nr:hypothetical protein J6590_008630 [Homalodisca vitripennis]